MPTQPARPVLQRRYAPQQLSLELRPRP